MVAPKQPSGHVIGQQHIDGVVAVRNQHHHDANDRVQPGDPVDKVEATRGIYNSKEVICTMFLSPDDQ